MDRRGFLGRAVAVGAAALASSRQWWRGADAPVGGEATSAPAPDPVGDRPILDAAARAELGRPTLPPELKEAPLPPRKPQLERAMGLHPRGFADVPQAPPTCRTLDDWVVAAHEVPGVWRADVTLHIIGGRVVVDVEVCHTDPFAFRVCRRVYEHLEARAPLGVQVQVSGRRSPEVFSIGTASRCDYSSLSAAEAAIDHGTIEVQGDEA